MIFIAEIARDLGDRHHCPICGASWSRKFCEHAQLSLEDLPKAEQARFHERTQGRFESVFCTSFCNQGHRLLDGKPINHECYVINPAALEAERRGDYDRALELMRSKRGIHPGLARP